MQLLFDMCENDTLVASKPWSASPNSARRRLVHQIKLFINLPMYVNQLHGVIPSRLRTSCRWLEKAEWLCSNANHHVSASQLLTAVIQKHYQKAFCWYQSTGAHFLSWWEHIVQQYTSKTSTNMPRNQDFRTPFKCPLHSILPLEREARVGLRLFALFPPPTRKYRQKLTNSQKPNPSRLGPLPSHFPSRRVSPRHNSILLKSQFRSYSNTR